MEASKKSHEIGTGRFCFGNHSEEMRRISGCPVIVRRGMGYVIVRWNQRHENEAIAAAETVGAADGLKKREGKKILPDPFA